jgi:hypothetical protein
MVLKAKTNPKLIPKDQKQVIGTTMAIPPEVTKPLMPETVSQPALSGVPVRTESSEVQLIGDFTPENLIQGIMMMEILGKPRCRGRYF